MTDPNHSLVAKFLATAPSLVDPRWVFCIERIPAPADYPIWTFGRRDGGSEAVIGYEQQEAPGMCSAWRWQPGTKWVSARLVGPVATMEFGAAAAKESADIFFEALGREDWATILKLLPLSCFVLPSANYTFNNFILAHVIERLTQAIVAEGKRAA